MQRTNVYLDEDQIRALKVLAAEQGRSLAELVRRAVDRLLADSHAAQDADPEQVGEGPAAARSEVQDARRAGGDEAVLALVREGLARPQRKGLPEDFWRMARPADPQGAVRAALLAEREES